MTRTVWNRGEKDEVLQAMIEIAAKRPSIPSKDLMREAQQRLPSNRRVIINDQRVFTYKKMIQAARDAAAKIKIVKPEVFEVRPEPPPEPPPKEQTIGELFEMLVDKISDRVIQKIEARQKQSEDAKQPIELEVIRPETVAPQGWLDELKNLSIRKKRKTSCLVIGLNGAQVDNIRQHKPDVDFTFVTGEQALSHHTFSKDHTILMTKFINHGVHNKYRKHPNMHYCNGGVSELKYLLNGLFGKP